MSRYIDFEVARKYLHEACAGLGSNGGLMLKIKFDQEPRADVVEVIRCEDCKHSHYYVNAHTDNYGTSVKAKVYCRVWQDWVPPEGYCFLADMRGGDAK